jgi:hypothetical protein
MFLAAPLHLVLLGKVDNELVEVDVQFGVVVIGELVIIIWFR